MTKAALLVLAASVVLGCSKKSNDSELQQLVRSHCHFLVISLEDAATKYREYATLVSDSNADPAAVTRAKTLLPFGSTWSERGPVSNQILSSLLLCSLSRAGGAEKFDAIENHFQTFSGNDDPNESANAIAGIAEVAKAVYRLPAKE